jgi:hypothetical protein
VYVIPSFVVGIALLGNALVRLVRHFVVENKLMATIGTTFVFLLTVLMTVHYDRFPLLNRFPHFSPPSQERALRAGRLGQDLQKLEALKKPIFVVAAAIPVMTKMFIKNMVGNRDSFQFRREKGMTFLNNSRNQFIFCNQGSVESQVIALRKKSEEFKDFYWVVDPYNPSIFKKPFNAHALILGKKLEF